MRIDPTEHPEITGKYFVPQFEETWTAINDSHGLISFDSVNKRGSKSVVSAYNKLEFIEGLKNGFIEKLNENNKI